MSRSKAASKFIAGRLSLSPSQGAALRAVNRSLLSEFRDRYGYYGLRQSDVPEPVPNRCIFALADSHAL
jgi:hypothetical protein